MTPWNTVSSAEAKEFRYRITFATKGKLLTEAECQYFLLAILFVSFSIIFKASNVCQRAEQRCN